MSISWGSKWRIMTAMCNHEHDRFADRFIDWLMANGEPFQTDESGSVVYIKAFGNVYGVWASNFPYADLSNVWEEAVQERYDRRVPPRLRGDTIYMNVRPSRVTKIRFYEWLNDHEVPMAPIDRRTRYLKKY